MLAVRTGSSYDRASSRDEVVTDELLEWRLNDGKQALMQASTGVEDAL